MKKCVFGHTWLRLPHVPSMRQGKFAMPMGPSRPSDSSSLQRHDTRANQSVCRDISEIKLYHFKHGVGSVCGASPGDPTIKVFG